ncbi:putative Ig domain-containing protein [Pseudomonas sp. Marseille-Q1929]|uniref:putative Ig domain-containing protein n=1 Tax=Pseudomonas sp. Marseille-Q1929 TaxID=2730402 RepID=UPI001A8D3A15|nr:putative Ig domain-containing protein [Pseudomonas sp. Marseille-Q1929]MBO0492204.1 putative Ig domain-containing protein [Pseudomonas sp. Marseille-Q1929]
MARRLASVLLLLATLPMATQALAAAPTITSPVTGSTLPSVAVGQSMNITITSSGGSMPLDQWAECDASDPLYTGEEKCLPDGLVLDASPNSSTTHLRGAPTTAGTYTFAISLNDNNQDAGVAFYTLVVTSGGVPTLTAVSPNTGSTAGGTSVTLTGTNLTGATSVSLGGTAATAFTVTSATSITATTPAHAAGAVNVVVTTPGGTATLTNGYTYATPTVSVGPTTLPNGAQNTAYSTQTITASGGAAPYTFAITSGALPAGLSLSSGGTLSGTPTASGTYNITVTATDANGVTGARAYSFTISAAPTISITPTTLPNPTANVAYTTSLSATGGSAPYSYTFTSGALPAGLSLSSGGTLSGTPTLAGTYNFSVTATDANSASGSRAYSVTVSPGAPNAGAVSVTVAANSSANPITLNLSGGAATSVAIASAASHGTATASGTSITYTPTAGYSGADSFTYTATNASGTSSPATVTLTVNAPTLSITPSVLTAPAANVAYSVALGASGGTAPYSYAITSGALPAGLSVNTSTGLLSGTPSVPGAYNFTVTVTDTYGATAGRTYSGTVSAGPPIAAPLNITVAANSSANSVALIINGGTATSVAVASAASHGTATASGTSITYTPTAGYNGVDSFTYTATNASGTSSPATVSVTVAAPTISISPLSLPNGTIGSAYSQTISASGSLAPYTYTVSSGSLPTGLSLSSAGALSGTPTVSGNFNFTVTAADAGTPVSTAARSYSFTINAVPPVAGAVSAIVAANSSANPITLNISGSAASSVAVASAPSHGTATASGTSITYTPTAGYSGADSFTYTATNSSGTSSPATVTVTIGAPTIGISPSALPAATPNVAFNTTVSASGGTAPYSYAISSGSLPPGISLNTATGTLSGTPLVPGPYTFTVTVTDANGATGSRTYSGIIQAPLPIAGALSATVAANSSANPITLNLSGGAATSVAVASVPSHGTATASGTGIRYTPTAGYSGADSFTYTASNSTGTSSPATVAITISAPSIGISPTVLSAATASVAFSTTLSASNGTAPYAYSITGGSVPTGMALNTATGTLSGTPTAAGPYNFTVTVTDANGATGSRAYSGAVNVAAPIAGALSASVAANSGANAITLNLSGGAATSVAVASAPSHGTATASGAGITYTPTAGYSGTDSFTYTATNSSGTSSPAPVAITISAPTLGIAPTGLGAATANVTFATTLSASGGTAPYSYSISSGATPAGVTLNSSTGTLSGTPTAAGPYTFTVTVTDANGATGSRAYSGAVNVAAPIAGANSATVAANSGANAITLNLSGGAATSVAVASAPSHGTATASGTGITYTPTAGYSGADSFTYTATNSSGTSSPATVTLAVTAPTLLVTPASLGAGMAGTPYSTTLSAAGGTAPYTYSVSSGSLPPGMSLNASSGVLSGTPTNTQAANVTITVTDANGATGLQAYTFNIAAMPINVAPSSQVLAAGQSATVDLTQGASGGPFTQATVGTVTPASAGRATRVGAFSMRFVPSAAFAGTAIVSFSLENGSGSIATSSVSFIIAARPDPTKDADVIGLLNAQTRAAERFASTQMDNFNRRLEQLHQVSCNRNSFNASVKKDGKDVPLQEVASAVTQHLGGSANSTDEEKRKTAAEVEEGCKQDDIAYWSDGFINNGSTHARGARDNSFTTMGLSAGVDYRLSPTAIAGIGFGYSNDRSDIGDNKTRSDGDALGIATYLSLNPASQVFVDGLLGYNRISFDSRRYITGSNDDYARGSRDADQLFASLTTSYEYRQGPLSLTPYGRLNASTTRLDAFRERGGGIYGLSYEEQRQQNVTSFLGLRTGYDVATRLGVMTPKIGLAWGHNFSGSSDYKMRYTDQGEDGLLYRLKPDPLDSDFANLDLGLDFNLGRAWQMGFSYKTALGSDERNDSFRIGVNGKF